MPNCARGSVSTNRDRKSAGTVSSASSMLRQTLLSLFGIVAAKETLLFPGSCRVEGAPAARLASG